MKNHLKQSTGLAAPCTFRIFVVLLSCLTLLIPTSANSQTSISSTKVSTTDRHDEPEYYHLRPEVEKAYGYTHAIRIGDHIKVSGAVSMDDQGNPTAVGDIEQQMKNCYADLAKILKHFKCTFDDVIVENIFTTDMPKMLQYAGYRSTIYKNKFPTGTWVGVKELALPPFMVEIELEVYCPGK